MSSSYLGHGAKYWADPELQRKAEKWKLGYTRLAAALKEKEKQYDALSAEKQRLECHLQERELYRGKTAEQWAELYFSEQRNYQKATSDLQESDSEIQTLNSTIANYHKFNEVDGHDATYWHHRYTSSQKEAFKANVLSALVIFFIAFSFGAVFGNHVGGSGNLSPSFQTAIPCLANSMALQCRKKLHVLIQRTRKLGKDLLCSTLSEFLDHIF